MKLVAPAALFILSVLALFCVGRPASPISTPNRAAQDIAPPQHVTTHVAAAAPRDVFRKPPNGPAVPPAPASNNEIDPAEKQARVRRIQRDYEAIRRQVFARYGEEGEAFPGGSHTLLRQFALLDQEKHADLARVLSPRELEDHEFRDTHAGRLVQRSLGNSAATDEQQRAVFRLQRAFDLRYRDAPATTPTTLDERGRAQQTLEQQIRAVLGNELFRAWVQRGNPPAIADGSG